MRDLKLLLVLAGALTTGCAAKLVQLPMPLAEDRAEVLIYRQASTLGKMQFGATIFGMNDSDVVTLHDHDYALILLPPSDYRFFVRSMSDRPFTVPLSLTKGERMCLKTYDDPTANLMLSFIPLTAFLTSMYILEEAKCPSDEDLVKFRRISVQ